MFKWDAHIAKVQKKERAKENERPFYKRSLKEEIFTWRKSGYSTLRQQLNYTNCTKTPFCAIKTYVHHCARCNCFSTENNKNKIFENCLLPISDISYEIFHEEGRLKNHPYILIGANQKGGVICFSKTLFKREVVPVPEVACADIFDNVHDVKPPDRELLSSSLQPK